MKLFRRNSKKSIAAGASTAPRRSFHGARTDKGLFAAALSIATLTAPLALHAQKVSFAGAFADQVTVPTDGVAPYSLTPGWGRQSPYIG